MPWLGEPLTPAIEDLRAIASLRVALGNAGFEAEDEAAESKPLGVKCARGCRCTYVHLISSNQYRLSPQHRCFSTRRAPFASAYHDLKNPASSGYWGIIQPPPSVGTSLSQLARSRSGSL